MSSLEELQLKQAQVLRSIERALTNYKKLGQNKMTLATTQNRISVLKEAFHQAQDLDARITAAVDEKTRASLPYFKDKQFDKCEDNYLECLDYMSEVIGTFKPAAEAADTNVSHSSSNVTRPTSHLPRIHLPSFDGTFDAWESFRDKFTSLVINEKSLSDVERLHFLCSSLKGEASNAISQLPITEKNFNVAWTIITSRYENKRRLIMTHLNTLFSLPHVTSESPNELQILRDRITVSTQALRNLGRPVDQWSDVIVFVGAQKLDRSSRKAWEFKLEDVNEFPTYSEFDAFLETRIRALEAIIPIKSPKQNETIIKSPRTKTIPTHTTNVTNITCPVCKRSHLIYQCPMFIAKTPVERYNFIKGQKRCVNCFSIKHTGAQCQSQHNCKECKQKHNTLLHFPNKSELSRAEQRTEPIVSESNVEISSNLVSHSRTQYGVLLSTAWVQVHSPQGRCTRARALLDQGSVATLVTEKLAQFLRLHRIKQQIRITGIGETNSVSHHSAKIIVTPATKGKPAYSTTAVIMKSLTRYVPPRNNSKSNWTHLSDVELADRDPMSSDPIDLIIGADLYSQLLRNDIRKGLPMTPIAQNTTLGWILSGPIASYPVSPSIDVHHSATCDDLDRTLRQFWELEMIPTQVAMTPEDSKCEHHFQTTHSRQADGRYVVRLPFKNESAIDLGESRQAALRSLYRVERRLQLNSTHRSMYESFMSEYETLGHMRKIPLDQTKQINQIYYIPHHAVFRENSSTTRLRVVFNASCRTTNGKSLNDHLLCGPKLQGDLFAMLLRWRQYQFVYTADIAKMYRQIRVSEHDVDYQRILWRSSPSKPVEEYQLLTVTYGTTSAPYHALRVLKQLVKDEGAQFPLANQVLQYQTYVDDCLFGADDPMLLREIRDQLIAVLAKGGFRLPKWASNASSLLEDIDPSDHGLAVKSLQVQETIPVLGVVWNPALDQFHFQVSNNSNSIATKRTILSTVAKLFDPLGWIAPVIVSAKILMQQLWAACCDWDEEIPVELNHEWQKYCTQLQDLELIHVPRLIAPNEIVSQSLHGFADASSKAYAAVVYMRSVLQTGTVWVKLLTAKSRVAPVKTISVPRLELCAALLLSHLISFVRTSLYTQQYECHCWTDSSITLTWLSQSPAKWKTFVATRVSKIQTLLPHAQWHHVSTHDNPADCASRGMSPIQLKQHELWWSGPAWLKESQESWPRNLSSSDHNTTGEEQPARVTSLVATTESFDLSSRYSSWSKLLRVTAYLMRFIERLRVNRNKKMLTNQDHPMSMILSPDEITRAKFFWLKRIQFDNFPKEARTLSVDGTVPKSSPLLGLAPYLDANGLIRAKGRLSKSQLPENAKRPIILSSHPLLTLLIRHTHLVNLHSGPQLTLACLRNDYWLLRARATVRAVLYKCVICTREKAAIPSQLMGDLPTVRISKVERPFIHTGVDYAGPIQVRTSPGRGHKSHKASIALFICMTTKALHLEVVSDYSSTAFLASYHRFVARRGLPTSMYSDNGTTFQGANRELRENVQKIINNTDLQNKLSLDGVAWHFLPPAAPHFGGLWEAAVKSVKHHLRRCIGSHTLTFEEITTFLCKVEACLNSRPIAPTSECIDDYQALTPGHFLIGSALVAVPEPSVLDLNENRLSRWQLIQRLTEIFWKAWTNDYMHTLHQRPKWKTIQILTKVGQIVLVRNANSPPSTWELGRIVACHPGDDGIVRVVTIRTAQSEYKRPITKLCFLPVTINEANARPEN